MTVSILPADEFSCAHVARNLRELDAKEAFALRPHSDPILLGQELNALPFKWVISHETRPAAILGYYEMWPGVFSLFLFTTADFPKVVLKFSRFVRHMVIPHLYDSGAHRAEVRVLSEYTGAKRLLAALGAKNEGRVRRFGRNGEDFDVFSWVTEDIAHGRTASQRRLSRKSSQG